MTRGLSWLGILRLGLVQAAIGATVVFVTSTLNRIMVIELALPAVVPGTLVALHYAVQMLRPRFGHGSDSGRRRTPWILGGMTVLALGAVLAAVATAIMAAVPLAGLALATLAYGVIGLGVGAAGTSVLTLLATEVSERRRAAAATIVWMMMIAGFIVTAGVVGHLLDPFSPRRLVVVALIVAGGAFLATVAAVWGLEPTSPGATAAMPRPARQGPSGVAAPGFWPALREVWADAPARRFTLFIVLSMLAYSAQELIVEPFVGTVLHVTPAESARFAGAQHSGVLLGMALVAILGSAVGGRRLGAMRTWTVAGCLASAAAVLGLAVAGRFGDVLVLKANIVALGAANGIFSIAAVGAMMQLAAAGVSGREGIRMGLWGAAQALAFAAGGLIGNGVSDLGRHVFGSATAAYAAVFVMEAVLFGLAALLAAKAFAEDARPRPAVGAAEAPRWAT